MNVEGGINSDGVLVKDIDLCGVEVISGIDSREGDATCKTGSCKVEATGGIGLCLATSGIGLCMATGEIGSCKVEATGEIGLYVATDEIGSCKAETTGEIGPCMVDLAVE